MGDIYAEKNFIRYALFVSFFPQLVAGPIERSKNLLMQLYESHSFEYENLRKELMLILYGLFLKMVKADKAAIIVNTVYENSMEYLEFYIVVATLFFTIQIYCDFYGYSTIARGLAIIMGIQLMDNFNAPYYSKSITYSIWCRILARIRNLQSTKMSMVSALLYIGCKKCLNWFIRWKLIIESMLEKKSKAIKSMP